MRTPLEKAVEEAQRALTDNGRFDYDRDSWDIYVGNLMQDILDAARADALNVDPGDRAILDDPTTAFMSRERQP